MWRILAQASIDQKESDSWKKKILAAFEDLSGSDRLHAIETLAKLKYPVHISEGWLENLSQSEIDSFTMYCLWNAAYHAQVGEEYVKRKYISVLKSCEESNLLYLIGFVMRRFSSLEPSEWDVIYDKMKNVLDDNPLLACLLTTLWITIPPSKEYMVEEIRVALLSLKHEKENLFQIFTALGECGEKLDWEILTELYKLVNNRNDSKYDADLHATAAYAVLKLSKRMGAE